MSEEIFSNVSDIPNLAIILLFASAIGYMGYWLVYNMYRFDTKGQVYRINIFMLPSLLIMYDNFNLRVVILSFIITIIIAWIWKLLGKYIIKIFVIIFIGKTYYDGINAHSELSTKIASKNILSLIIFFNEQGEIDNQKRSIDGINRWYFQSQLNSDFKIDEQGNIVVTEYGIPYDYVLQGNKHVNKNGRKITYISASNIKYISIYEREPSDKKFKFINKVLNLISKLKRL
ncbi:MAG: hypothetical protein LBH40_05665 [Alphaproteobacteria bacterium]|jgi:hypothetical protein|nr:hypothetical protein [Alphaproteobacteria bacterium]